MSSAYDKLRRILALERDQGCHDRAVVGGLARFLAYWKKQARQEEERASQAVPVDLIVATLSGYAEVSVEERRQAIDGLLESLSVEPGWPVADQSARPAPARPRPAKGAATPEPEAPVEDQLTLDSPVSVLKGVGTVNESRLARLGVRKVRDLLYHFPRRYDDYSKLEAINRLTLGDEVTIVGIVQEVHARHTRSRKAIVEVTLSDGTGTVQACWFNQPYLQTRFRVGSELAISGRVEEYLGRLVFNSPRWEPLQRELLHTGRLVPVHPLTEGITSGWLRRLVRNTLDSWVPRILDPLPPSLLTSAGLMGLRTALEQSHFPDSHATLKAALERLCFDEFFLFQLGMLRRRQAWLSQRGRALHVRHTDISRFAEQLPFRLTNAQNKAIQDILADLQRPVPMSRLLQGDVGSGKTVVAVVAAVVAARNGLQAAIMAPTTVLAEQHYDTISRMFKGHEGIRSALLTGSLSAGEKRQVQEEIARGRIQVIVGTHALIEDSVDFSGLGLVVVDEQHRFGVAQRGALRAKGDHVQPHLLAMSATPIPRTLALTIYGDLDISVLDELPPNREPVITAVRSRSSRERIYSFINGQIAEGRQAFVICPLVEESGQTDAKAAVAEHQHLQQEVFPHLRIGLLHGRMGAQDKERTMADFKERRYDILVSTAVVEVGIDVPNASVILVEGAERFGLAQLHQFRGRVGRAKHKSYCILLSDDPSQQSLERLRIMEQTSDGFVLAEKDLEMRGPGDFFGVRQHGLPELKVAKLSDVASLEKACREALRLFEEDPNLDRPEHQMLATSVRRFWSVSDLS